MIALKESSLDCTLCAKLLRAFDGDEELNDMFVPVSAVVVYPYGDAVPERVEELRGSGIVAKYAKALVNMDPREVNILVKAREVEVTGKPGKATGCRDADPRQGALRPSDVHADLEVKSLAGRAIWNPQIPAEDVLRRRLETIEAWLRECREKHPLCGSYKGAALPTRLLDTGTELGIQYARLVDSSSIDQSDSTKASYIALSHCWGSSPGQN
jgi:hypothetical protein